MEREIYSHPTFAPREQFRLAHLVHYTVTRGVELKSLGNNIVAPKYNLGPPEYQLASGSEPSDWH